jgi:polysaccharide biosynthesis protein PslJ
MAMARALRLHGLPLTAALAVTPIALLLGVAAASSPLITIGAFLAVCGGLVLFAVPVELLPAIAIWVFCLLPVNDLPVPELFRAASPGVVILVIWLVRRGRRPPAQTPPSTRVLAALVVVCLLATTVVTISVSRSLVWTFAFVASVLLPIFARGFSAREGRLLIANFIGLSAVLSCFAVVEYAIRDNPLLGHLYERSPYPLIQHWSTYRVTTTLGHPLNNALVFSAAAVAAFAAYLETRHLRMLGAFVLTLIGLFLTGSRGALYLTPVALLLVVVAYAYMHSWRLQGLGRLLLLLGIAGAIAVGLYAQTIGARASTGEALSSSNVRNEDVRVGLARARKLDYLGSGPGTSNSARNEGAELIGDSSIVIENSYIQLLISIGLPGLLLIVALFSSIVRDGIRNHALPAVGAFFASVLVIATFNFAEGVRPGLILLGLLAGACLARSAGDQRTASPG